MSEIATSDRQISLFYVGNSNRAKQSLAYAKALGLTIFLVDWLKTALKVAQFAKLVTRLGYDVKDLVNQNHPSSYSSKFEHHDLSTEDWIKMIRYNPEIMKQPIALQGKKTILVETPSDIIKI